MMLLDRLFRAPLLGTALSAVVLFSLYGCDATADAALGSGSNDVFREKTIRLDSAEAARLAREAKEAVSVELAEDLSLELWAPETLVPDPVALSADPQGRLYFTRTSRERNSEIDIRGHPDWMTESIRMQTLEDRRAFLRRELAPERSDQNTWLSDLNGDGSHDWRDLTVEKERVYRLEDTSGDGIADESRLIFEGIDSEVSDLALGVLIHGRDLYLGAAPDLWRLRDEDGDGSFDSRESISHGYKVHIGFGSHGISSPVVGPDGRIYWAIGDLGLNVVDSEGQRWAYPNQGAILRAEPDGSNFEVFAAGLRNTHEFVFDDYGNLISVDNDGDHPGETERLVYIVDGSDSGWRTNWQFGKYNDPTNNAYKVWMDEELYKPRFSGQAAHITPPIASYHTGPAGMAYNPGTALSERWRDHFFVSEFTGSPATSKIHAFRLEQQGAGFELAKDTVLMSGILATGLEFGPDGAMYVGDWVEGWGAKDRGRIWKLDSPAADSTLRSETRRLLREPFGETPAPELIGLLRHADRRVRLKAQFALVERGESEALLGASRQPGHQVARLHAIWGLGQLARKNPERAQMLTPLLRDTDAEVRAQVAKVIGDAEYAPAAEALVPLLGDPAPRVRFFAAQALGRLEHRPAVRPLLEMLEANDGNDAYLRHAGTLALARIGEVEPILALTDHPSRAMRLAAVVVLRRLQHPEVARFLEDRDEWVVTDAARAINDDGGIEAALPALAKTLERTDLQSEALLRRAISANLRVGTREAAQRLVDFAARSKATDVLRAEAIAALGSWSNPSVLDRVDGTYLGERTGNADVASAALSRDLQPLIREGGPRVRAALAESAARLKLTSATPLLATRVKMDPVAEVRIAALKALHTLNARELEDAVRNALTDEADDVRRAALELLPSLALAEEVKARLVETALEHGTTSDRQRALDVLAELPGTHGVNLLDGLLAELEAGTLRPEIELELREAVLARGTDAQRQRLAAHEAIRAETAGAYHYALQGGDARQGREVVFKNAGAQCTRCHTLAPEGPTVGPDLRGVGARLNRTQLLEALVAPSARLAPGYGSVTLKLEDGSQVQGLLEAERAGELLVRTAAGTTRRVQKSEIVERVNAPSAMPPMTEILSPRELRDVVEYLASLR